MTTTKTQPPEAGADHNFHPNYRPDIDGLRAVAILSVVLFHAFPSGLQGGFVGVDIFFVISGFLISTIIFRSLQKNDFSCVEFYAHRVKRIFPALIVVLAACYTFGWFALLPDGFTQLGKHMAAGAGFVQNFVLWKEAGYFDTASELKPLMHLWSLAIEEQFYLIYPVLIWAAWRAGLNVLTVVILLALISFGLNVHWIGKDAVETFFVPQTRFWELLAGSVLAYFQFFKPKAIGDWLSRWVFHRVIFKHPPFPAKQGAVLVQLTSVLGLLLIILAVFTLHKGKPFPGWWALAPVVGAVLLIFSGPNAWVNQNILGNRLMVFVGLISYPLYLWHWPILSFARIVESEMPAWEIRIAAIAVSFVLAWLTYRLVERPIRFGQKSWVKTAILVALLAIVGYVGFNTYSREGLAFRPISRHFQEYTKITNVYEYFNYAKVLRGSICHAVPLKTAIANGCVASADRKSIMIWGDSYAAALFPGLQKAVETRHPEYSITQLTDGNGPPFIGDAKSDSGATLMQVNQDRLKGLGLSNPEIVLITWMMYGQNAIHDKTAAIAAFSTTVSQIKAKSPKSRIVVIGPVPEWQPTLLKQIIAHTKVTGRLPPMYMRQGLDKRLFDWDATLRDYLPKIGVQYVSALDAVCSPDGCLTRLSDNPKEMVAVDWGHLTAAGSEYLVGKLDTQIFGK